MKKQRWRIDGKTEVFAVLGQSTAHSMSPIIHNASFENLGLNALFVGLSCPPNKLAAAFKGMQALGIKGAAIIIPYKVAVMKYCTEIDLMARQIGAVNTIQFKDDGSIVGFNTDAEASAKALLLATGIKGKNILMLGAGGAARAVGFQMAVENAGSLTVANRTLSKAAELCDQIADTFDNQIKTKAIILSKKPLSQALDQTDILINTTSVGMDSAGTLVTADMLRSGRHGKPGRPGMVVFDIVYTPYQTKLLQEAEKAGAETIPGANMLVYQAMEQEKIWLKVNPSFKVMKDTMLEELMGNRSGYSRNV